MRATTAPSSLEALRRLGALRRRRTYVLGKAVFRVRRDKLVRIPDAWTNPDRVAGERRKCEGKGSSGRMDWERQQRVLKLHKQGGRRRRYSRFTRDEQVARFEKAGRWNLRAEMIEWLYWWERDFYEYGKCDGWDDYDDDDARGVAWADPWSVTLPDLMR
jgi:hypothetical protein